MPASTATVGYGSILAWSATEGGTYAAIAQTRDLPGPEPEVGDVNITNNDSPDNTKEYIPGMIEPGELDFELVYKKAVCATLYGMFGNQVVYWWKETFLDGSTWKFPGYLKKFGTETETEDKEIQNNVTIKLTGKPVFAAGS